jgi:hypothetical protein
MLRDVPAAPRLMVMRICIKCGRIFEGEGSRCADHPNRWRSGSTREWRQTRERILARDGYRCTVHVRPGERCEGTKLLEVHHIYGGDALVVADDSYEPSAASTTRAAAKSY